MTNILVSGLINIETTVAVRGFPIDYYPIDYPFFGIESRVAGVGYNIARALTTLGDGVRFYSFAGNDAEGARIEATLQSDGIVSTHVAHSLQSTPTSVVLFDPSGRRQIYCDLKDAQEMILTEEEVGANLENCAAAVLCNIGFNRRLIKAARARGVLTATDVHVLRTLEDDYNRDFMENADILFLSDEGLPCPPEEFIRQLEERCRNRVIVIGQGARGALLLDAEKEKLCQIPAYTAGKVVNTVGAGDALFSAFLHFYIKTGDAEQALRHAVVFAGVKVCQSGASSGFCSEEEVLKRS